MSRAKYAAEIEALLVPLIRRHGWPTVRAAIEKLVDRASTADWFQLQNVARNVSNRIERRASQ